MRVHPTVLAPKVSKWHLPVAFGVLIFLLGLNLFRGPSRAAVAVQAPVEKRLEVLVAKEFIDAGQPFEKAAIVFEQRPVTTLPADVVTSMDVLKQKVAAGPIPAGYPLAKSLIADAVPVVQTVGKENLAVEGEDPIESILKEIEAETVAVQVNFENVGPPRGTRIAVMANRRGSGDGNPLIVVEDCWVAKTADRVSTLRVDSSRALILTTAMSAAELSYIEIPREGGSPFLNQGIRTVAELQDALGIRAKQRQMDEIRSKAKAGKMRNLAWIPGTGMRYGIDDSGEIMVLDQNGEPIELKLPDSFRNP